MNSVDIIIPMFNSKKFVAETINSVNYPNCNGLILNFFIVDDGFRLEDKLDQKVDWIFADFFASLSYRWKYFLGPSPFVGSIATG